MKLMLGCVSREVVDAASQFDSSQVGLIASYSQAGAGKTTGYSGFSGDSLTGHCREVTRYRDVWRDHANTAPHDAPPSDQRLALDAAAGFDGAMPDWLPCREAYRACYNGFMSVELGHGEDPCAGQDLREILDKQASEVFTACSGSWIVTHVSGWLGTNLKNGTNSIDLPVMKRQMDVLTGFAATHGGLCIRAHNCDFLTRDHLTTLRDVGVHEFNYAPELGKVVGDAWLGYSMPIMRERLVQDAYRHGGWNRWGPVPAYGIHYVLEQSRSLLPSTRYDDVVDLVVGWITERLAWLTS